MTDQELICSFMEPKPAAVPDDAEDMHLCGSPCMTPNKWWVCAGGYDVDYAWRPRHMTLDALHEVEMKLWTGKPQAFTQYVNCLVCQCPGSLIIASAEQKLKALALAIRKESGLEGK